MTGSSAAGSSPVSIDALVRVSQVRRSAKAVASGAKKVYELGRDPYSWTQLAANIPDRALRLVFAHYVLTGGESSFLANTAEVALFTAVSIPVYELITTPVHRRLFRKKRGTLEGFVNDRIGVETQHYKARAICTTAAILTTSALEYLTGIPRELSTQVAGIPFGWIQGGYTTDIRQRVDAGKPLDRPIDHAVSAPFRPLGAAWKLVRGKKAADYLVSTGKSAAVRTASYLTGIARS